MTEVRGSAPETEPSGWYAILPDRPPASSLAGKLKTDFAIIGAGFTGMSAAASLADRFPSASIAILDAQRVGQGSSGRNSGFVVDVGHFNPHLSVQQNRNLTMLQRLGGRILKDRVQASGIACGWNPAGRIHAAVSARGCRMLDKFKTQLDAMKEPYAVRDRAQIADITSTSYYAAGIHTPGGTLVQPAALICGLAGALPPAVQLFENSPVTGIESVKAGVNVKTPEGELMAERVLICVNGRINALQRSWPRLFPLLTFASLTAPLGDRYPAALLLKRKPWGLISEDKMGSTVRWTDDQRLLIRNSIVYSPHAAISRGTRDAIVNRHRQSLAARFPDLHDAPFEFFWGGTVGVTLNATPQFLPCGERIWVAGGCNGVGIALGSAMGALAADLMAGRQSAELEALQSLPQPSPLPPSTILRVGVPPTLAWMQWRSGADC